MPDIQTVREDLAPFRAEHERAKAATEDFQTGLDTKLSSVLQAWLFTWAELRCKEIIASVNMRMLISAEARVEEDVTYPGDVALAFERSGLDLVDYMIDRLEKSWDEGIVMIREPISEEGVCFIFEIQPQ